MIIPTEFHEESVILLMDFSGVVLNKIKSPIFTKDKIFSAFFFRDFLFMLEKNKSSSTFILQEKKEEKKVDIQYFQIGIDPMRIEFSSNSKRSLCPQYFRDDFDDPKLLSL